MLKRLTVWFAVLALCLCSSIVPAYAEDDISGWADAQEAADSQIQWAQLQGVEVDTSAQAENITKRCKFKVSEGSRDRLTNGKVGSPWKYEHSDAWVGIQLPDDVTPGAIRLEWMFDPTGYELVEYDADQNPLRTRTQDDAFPSIYTVYALNPSTRSIQLKMTAKDQGVSNIALYSAGVLPADVQTWLPPVEKADMMVFSTHQDDEVIFLGGTIPYSDVVCGRPTITVYMANCNRDRRREALECLWEMGSRHYPEFINMKDEKVSSIDKGLKLWGGKDNILKEIVARIRRYKPEVIVTQALDGEYGHNQHKIVANAMQPAIEAAADPNQYPDSYNLYGAWQVKKLYIHLYKENQIHMDWKTPQDACGGLSLLEVARKGMEKHASQTKYFKVRDGGQYDNSLFGLALTTVGEDVAKNDFFENIPLGNTGSDDTMDDSAENTPEPENDDGWEDATETEQDDNWQDMPETEEQTEVYNSDEAVDTATEVSDADESRFAPLDEGPVPGPATENEVDGGHGTLLVIGLTAIGIAAVGAGTWSFLRQSSGKKRRRKRGKKRGRTGGQSKKAVSNKKKTARTAQHVAKHAAKKTK